MFHALFSRRLAVAVAGAALLSMTAACGASAGDAACTEAAWTKIFSDYTAATTSSAGDFGKFNDATDKLAADLKTLADTTEGDLSTALTDLSTTFGSVKIDENDPAAAATAVSELGTKVQKATAALSAACS